MRPKLPKPSLGSSCTCDSSGLASVSLRVLIDAPFMAPGSRRARFCAGAALAGACRHASLELVDGREDEAADLVVAAQDRVREHGQLAPGLGPPGCDEQRRPDEERGTAG